MSSTTACANQYNSRFPGRTTLGLAVYLSNPESIHFLVDEAHMNGDQLVQKIHTADDNSIKSGAIFAHVKSWRKVV